ncbi:hypothetical protein B0H15DRAFT_581014 [Mycena belliarum]|uniref:Uncharacterized protein n=1 Tax=Mycena belliarum TaxID=1033014 RepID=A0AAD6UBY1_9AGAR|nr:hypothetical protein B0H15DRAFT_581014 [Mycena belliae]
MVQQSCPAKLALSKMPQMLYIAGIACLSLALLFNFLATVSVPAFQGVDVVRVVYPPEPGNVVKEDRFGIWGFCEYAAIGNDHICHNLGGGYPLGFNHGQPSRAWTRGLAIQPFVLILNAAALVLAVLNQELLVALASLLAGFFALLAFVINIAFYAHVRSFACDCYSQHCNVIYADNHDFVSTTAAPTDRRTKKVGCRSLGLIRGGYHCCGLKK